MKMGNIRDNGHEGFTLVEILIAITIMSALTVFTAQSIQSALRTSTKYRKQIDETAELRDVLRIIEKDINLAFNYRDVHKEMQDALDKENKKKPEEGSDEPPAALPGDVKDRPNYTEFKGEPESLHFTSLSNVRTILDSPESDQAEVGYFLKTCQHRGNNKKTSTCLWRRLSPILDDKVDEGGRSIVLIENVKSFSLRYMGEATKEQEPEWLETWKSGKDGEEKTKDKFPSAVEIELSVERKLGKKTVVQKLASVAPIRFTNNRKKEEKEGEGENTSEETNEDGDDGKN